MGANEALRSELGFPNERMRNEVRLDFSPRLTKLF